MGKTVSPPRSASRRRNPYDPGRYKEDVRDNPDPRDKRWEQEGEDSDNLLRFALRARRKNAAVQLEMVIKALTIDSSEKPRWQKIMEHANSLADRLGMSREKFYETALIEYIEKLENARISEELNEAYKSIDQQEENAFLNRLVSHYDPRLADE